MNDLGTNNRNLSTTKTGLQGNQSGITSLGKHQRPTPGTQMNARPFAKEDSFINFSRRCTLANRTAWSVLLVVSLTGCAKKAHVPVNEGREYDNPKTPLFVMHSLEKNQWSLNRVDNHGIFKRFMCFDLVCRTMIGRSKSLLVISKKEFIKQIKKNAERGLLNTSPGPPAKHKSDSLKIPTDTTTTAKLFSPASVAPATRISSVPKADTLITFNEFLFETNSYKLRSEHYAELKMVGDYLRLHPTLKVSISGHTDNVGDERHNVMLSARRAESVAEFLVGSGIDYGRVVFKGYGSSKPIEPNNSPQGRAKNRRVEILIQDPKK